MLNGVWFDYKGTKGFFMSLVYLHRKKIQSQNVNKFSLQILSLSLSLIMNTVYLHPGGGGAVFESVCVALEAPVEAP